MNDATRRQVTAADPRASTWLSANAGSGKTRVLTDRVARLLLEGASSHTGGVPPQNILCLTYTKAAAGEMQNRLFSQLGNWAMLDDAALRMKLVELGITDVGDPDLLAKTRRLFARAIEAPGGLRIQTIHSFCAVLLRRFPLEAGVSPQFREMDDRAGALLRTECLDEIAEQHRDVFDQLATIFSGFDLDDLAAQIVSKRHLFAPSLSYTALCEIFEISPDLTEDDILSTVFLGHERQLVDTLCAAMSKGTPSDFKNAAPLKSLSAPWTVDDLDSLEKLFLYGKDANRPFGAKTDRFPTKATQKHFDGDLVALHDWMVRIEVGRKTRLGLRAARYSAALHAFADVLLPIYEKKKALRAWLDFDDLIVKARGLLTSSEMASWVLYRLDGGIDHILVDEAQDTSPAQWQVIEALAQEFASGDGARQAGERTLFVVGDQKQSIYSFQGADPEAFDRMRALFSDQLAPVAPLQRLDLLHSFRSSNAILTAVDATFATDAAQGLGTDMRHVAFHDDMPGRVDLWPAMIADKDDEEPDWHNPVDLISPASAQVLLAKALAKEIRRMIDEKETIPAQDGIRKPVSEGDFLILVRKRSGIFPHLIRACKAEGLKIAGADRLRLTEELAVKDLLALMRFLATPEDDLSLAVALRSPLFDWSEQDLYRLAAHRGPAYLWQAVRASDSHKKTVLILQDLLREADFLRPYELLHRILLRHGGRQNLLARLGLEALDGIDELLVQALNYEQSEIPSLTGFLGWLDADEIEVKREAESAGDKLRVMTVHGAKGLEAPIVILPETRGRKIKNTDIFVATDDGTAVWKMPEDARPAHLDEIADRLTDADAAERARLLYVAMTRAEKWLIVCGSGSEKVAESSWYEGISDGFSRVDPGFLQPIETPAGPGERLATGDWDAGEVVQPAPVMRADITPPEWYTKDVKAPPGATAPMSPSDLPGAKGLAGPLISDEGEDAMRRGMQIHLLLEHLPQIPPEQWKHTSERLIGPDFAPILDHVRRVLEDPALLPILAKPALCEVPVTAPFGSKRLLGTVDRLLINEEEVLVIDYKSNTHVPTQPEDVPEGLVRQMGAYGIALRQIYTDKPVNTAILWTNQPMLMRLPSSLIANVMGDPHSLDAMSNGA